MADTSKYEDRVDQTASNLLGALLYQSLLNNERLGCYFETESDGAKTVIQSLFHVHIAASVNKLKFELLFICSLILDCFAYG